MSITITCDNIDILKNNKYIPCKYHYKEYNAVKIFRRYDVLLTSFVVNCCTFTQRQVFENRRVLMRFFASKSYKLIEGNQHLRGNIEKVDRMLRYAL